MAEEVTTQDPAATATADPTVGQKTSTESSLSNWVGDYVTDMLGRGWAMADQPYEAYTGPLTAGTSGLQNQAFSGLANLVIPQNTEFTPQSFTDPGVASRYMNPYVNEVVQNQLDEIRRQSEIQRLADAGRLTQAGAYGGSRQAIMESELNRNMLQEMSNATNKGYLDAYNLGAGQFNTEQNLGLQAAQNNQGYGLAALNAQLGAGGTQRSVLGEGIAADYAQFKEERDFPYKQVQYMQSLLQELPMEAQNYGYAQPSAFSTLSGGISGLGSMYQNLFGGDDGVLSGAWDWLSGQFGGDTTNTDTTTG